jgi:hypothetical protein
MDKVTKAFVIAASSVVIAVGGTWLYQTYVFNRDLAHTKHSGVIEISDSGHSHNSATLVTASRLGS